jgi:hypothetical protein
MAESKSDRATVVADTFLAIVANRLRDPAARKELIDVLRDEFQDIARQARGERRLD